MSYCLFISIGWEGRVSRVHNNSWQGSHGPTTPGWISAGTSWCQHTGLLPQPSRGKRNSKNPADLPSVQGNRTPKKNWGTGLNAYTQPMACGYICILIKKYCESVQNVWFSHIHLNVNSLQEKLLETAKSKLKFVEGSGPCNRALEQSLNDMHVQRQAYHGGEFIGNHVDKCLKVNQKQKIFTKNIFFNSLIFHSTALSQNYCNDIAGILLSLRY